MSVLRPILTVFHNSGSRNDVLRTKLLGDQKVTVNAIKVPKPTKTICPPPLARYFFPETIGGRNERK